MVQCLIVDDEPLAQQILSNYIRQTPSLQIAGVCNNALESFEFLQNNRIDLMFLDIRMPKISGMAFLKALKEPPAVIFVTAYSEYAAESYDWQATDYLVKPVTYDRFCKSIQKFLKSVPIDNTSAKQAFIFIKVDGKLVRIEHSSLLYIESKKDYLKVVTSDKSYLTHMTMKSMENLLPDHQFLRIHRSFLISIATVTLFSNAEVHIQDKVIPVGNHFKEKIREILISR